MYTLCTLCTLQFKLWSTIDERLVCRFTSDAKDKPLRELKPRIHFAVLALLVRALYSMITTVWLATIYLQSKTYRVIYIYVPIIWELPFSLLYILELFMKFWLFPPANTGVAISTYAMVAYTQKRAWDSQQVSWYLMRIGPVSSLVPYSLHRWWTFFNSKSGV